MLRVGRARVKASDLVPRFLLPSVASLVAAAPGDEDVEGITGVSPEGWGRLARAYPRLGSDPGPAAARARSRLRFLVARALASPRDAACWRGDPLDDRPSVYATAHVGDLRALRYLLRARIPAANVVAAADEERRAIAREDAAFDARFPSDFPHAFFAGRPHAIRAALKRGSLIVAADAPKPGAPLFPWLGGEVALDPRPFRLARLARVPCRAIFLTAPAGRLTITVGAAVPIDEAAALAAFAQTFARVAEETPYEIDAPTWASRLGAR